jgi:peptidoglycan/LPS O-acetylase OafA/YrhL
MGAVSLTARLALAAVFGVAVSAVLASAGGRRELTTMLGGVGVPARLIRAVGYAGVAAGAVATSVPAPPPVAPGPAVVCAVAAVLAAVLVVRWEDLYELLAGSPGRVATPAGGRKDVP